MKRASWPYMVCRFLVVGPVLQVVGRPKVSGLKHVPRRGSVILAANHLAVLDSFHLARAARRPVSFVAKREYFDGAGLIGRWRRRFFESLGQISVDRRGGSGALSALDVAAEILDDGYAWGIHPEGTRSPTGDMYKGHTGVIRVALRTGAPVVPVAITGTTRASRRGRLGRVRITILPPMDLSGVMPDDPVAVRDATDRLMASIQAVTKQRYIDEYASRVAGRAGYNPRVGQESARHGDV